MATNSSWIQILVGISASQFSSDPVNGEVLLQAVADSLAIDQADITILEVVDYEQTQAATTSAAGRACLVRYAVLFPATSDTQDQLQLRRFSSRLEEDVGAGIFGESMQTLT